MLNLFSFFQIKLDSIHTLCRGFLDLYAGELIAIPCLNENYYNFTFQFFFCAANQEDKYGYLVFLLEWDCDTWILQNKQCVIL